MNRSRWIFAVLSSAVVAAACPAAVQAQSLDLVGQSALGGGGQNGDVAVVGNTAIVGAGLIQGGGVRVGFYNGTYTCPQTSVKVVDISNPSAPTFVEIPQPVGIIANDVAALRVSTPAFTGDLAAVARVACAPGTAGGPRR